MVLGRGSTAQSINIEDARAPPKTGAADLHALTADPAPPQFQQILAQVDELKRKLASSQQELIASRHQLEFLTKANAQLRELAVRREYEPASGPSRSSPRNLTELRISTGLDLVAMGYTDQFLAERVRLRKGEPLYQAGEAFTALYMIRVGSCKTVLLSRAGESQVAGYHMAGEILGMDGIGTDVHKCQVIALEATEAYVLPFDEIETLAQLSGEFQRSVHKMLSDQCGRAQDLMILMGTMHADQRLAVFLLDLSQRYQARGYSSCEYVLRMTREEIGSYLGLKLETVSRIFSRLQHEGLIQVQGRTVKLLDRVGLSRIVDCGG